MHAPTQIVSDLSPGTLYYLQVCQREAFQSLHGDFVTYDLQGSLIITAKTRKLLKAGIENAIFSCTIASRAQLSEIFRAGELPPELKKETFN